MDDDEQQGVKGTEPQNPLLKLSPQALPVAVVPTRRPTFSVGTKERVQLLPNTPPPQHHTKTCSNFN